MKQNQQPGLVALEQRIAELEIAIAFQDDTLAETQKTLAYQQQAIQGLERKLLLLSEYIKSLREDPIKPLNEETPPPHY